MARKRARVKGAKVPKQYEAMRDALLKKGKSSKTAKRIAAATYNKRRPKGAKPVGRYTD